MDTMMESAPNQMAGASPTDLVVYAEWAAENFTPADLSSLENALNANYEFPFGQMTLSPASDDSFMNALYDVKGTFPESSSPDPRYGSLDCERPDAAYSLPLERCSSLTTDIRENAKERRRTQNRLAQRAYRQRKEQAIRNHEEEIETLKTQIEKEKKLNQALAKVVEFLKGRVKDKQPDSRFGTAPSQKTTLVTSELPGLSGGGFFVEADRF